MLTYLLFLAAWIALSTARHFNRSGLITLEEAWIPAQFFDLVKYVLQLTAVPMTTFTISSLQYDSSARKSTR